MSLNTGRMTCDVHSYWYNCGRIYIPRIHNTLKPGVWVLPQMGPLSLLLPLCQVKWLCQMMLDVRCQMMADDGRTNVRWKHTFQLLTLDENLQKLYESLFLRNYNTRFNQISGPVIPLKGGQVLMARWQILTSRIVKNIPQIWGMVQNIPQIWYKCF